MTPMLHLRLQQRLLQWPRPQQHQEIMTIFCLPMLVQMQLPVPPPTLPDCQINHLNLTEPTIPLHRRRPYNHPPRRIALAALAMPTVIMHR